MKKENIWVNEKLPVMEFTHIDTAEKILGMSKADIIALAHSGAIETYVYLYKCKAKSLIYYDIEKAKYQAKVMKSGGVLFLYRWDVNPLSERNEYNFPVNLWHQSEGYNNLTVTAYWIENADEFICNAERANDGCEDYIRMIAYLYVTGYVSVKPNELKVMGFSNKLDGIGDLASYIQFLEIKNHDMYIRKRDVEKVLSHVGRRVPVEYTDDIHDNENSKHVGLHDHGNVEFNAKKREQLLMSAIYLLNKYPEECRGTKKAISPEKWKNCLLSHKDEINPLMITSEDVILRHLRAAVNGKV